MIDEHEIICYSQAKIRKLKFYYTGKACKYGHRAQRYTVDKHCVVCKKIKNRKYLIEGGYARKYYRDNLDHISEYSKKRYLLKKLAGDT
ncbi:hypothetical protein [Vreelandella sulfidaeris]